MIAPVKHPDNGYRYFTEREAIRLRMIMTLREFGMSVEEVKSVLDRLDQGRRNEVLYALELQRSVCSRRGFDFVVSSYALHHLIGEQKILALSEMQRTLKPHGRICIVDLMVDVAELLEAGEKVSTPGKEESELPVYCAERSRMLDWFDRHGYFAASWHITGRLHQGSGIAAKAKHWQSSCSYCCVGPANGYSQCSQALNFEHKTGTLEVGKGGYHSDRYAKAAFTANTPDRVTACLQRKRRGCQYDNCEWACAHARKTVANKRRERDARTSNGTRKTHRTRIVNETTQSSGFGSHQFPNNVPVPVEPRCVQRRKA